MKKNKCVYGGKFKHTFLLLHTTPTSAFRQSSLSSLLSGPSSGLTAGCLVGWSWSAGLTAGCLVGWSWSVGLTAGSLVGWCWQIAFSWSLKSPQMLLQSSLRTFFPQPLPQYFFLKFVQTRYRKVGSSIAAAEVAKHLSPSTLQVCVGYLTATTWLASP